MQQAGRNLVESCIFQKNDPLFMRLKDHLGGDTLAENFVHGKATD